MRIEILAPFVVGTLVPRLATAINTPTTERNWSIGAGVGLPDVPEVIAEVSEIVDHVPLGLGRGRRPQLRLLFERRLTAGLFLQFHGGFDRASRTDEFHWSSDWNDGDSSEHELTTTVVSTTVGLRWLANPGAPVELSPFIALAFSRASVTIGDSDTYDGGDASSSAYGIGLGFAAEKSLLDGLILRFSTVVLRATRTATRETDSDYDYRDEHEIGRTSFSVTLRPAVELRMTF